MNVVAIIGNITKELELRSTRGGKNYTEFGIAVNETWKDKDGKKQEAVSFFNVISWGKQAEVLCKWFEKGQQIHVTGKLRQERWEKDGKKHNRVNIIMQDFGFGQKPKNAAGKKSEDNPREQFDESKGEPEPAGSGSSDDGAPF